MTAGLRGAVFVLGLSALPAAAQSTELLVGAQRATQDVMFFKFFPGLPEKDAPPPRSDVLFFFRARASEGYTATDALPLFGLTAAVSWNPAWLKGFAPVVVGQAFNRGLVAKAGVQFAYVSQRVTVFSWVVSELRGTPAVDAFALGRYVHPLSELLGLFFQAEALASFPTRADEPLSFTQRARIGLQLHRFQLGPGLDLAQVGRETFALTINPGGFIRFEL